MDQLLDEVPDLNLLRLRVGDVCKDASDLDALLDGDPVENLLESLDAVHDGFWDQVVRVSQLDLLQDGEGDRVDEDDASVYARGVDDEDLLVAILQGEKPRLGAAERLGVVQVDVVLAGLVRADGESLLGG
jgi:hypothetical protein